MTCAKPADHTWQPTPRASSPSVLVPGATVPAVCTGCGTRYPCRACDHLDCITERGEPLPAWITVPPEIATPAPALGVPTETPDAPLPDDDPTVTPETSATDDEAS